MNKEDKFKLLMLQVRYLKAQLDVDKETHSVSMIEFSKEFNKAMKTLPKDEKERIEDNTTENLSSEQKKKANKNEQVEHKPKPKKIESSLRKTFQDVAKKTHPDKLLSLREEEKQYRELLFKQAQDAVEEKDLMKLFDVAEKLDIKMPPPNEEQIELLQKDIKKTRNKIKEIKSTASWEWYHANDVDRKSIMLAYLRLLYKGGIK
tara:strand:+ start:174 stop:788 length:615 start_codon:yes stop_codon:yes gene_type:complete